MTDIPVERGIFCNRTLNLRSIKAIGYDMDYTLVHYNVDAWEGRAYEYIRQGLLELGWPLEDLTFEPERALRGLVVDLELGNLIKINRYGYVKRATHGTHSLTFEEMRKTYTRTMVDLGEPRYHFLNTLFSLSEGCMYAQLVDLMDANELPGVRSYPELWRQIRHTLDTAHVEGKLKAEIMAHPERYVELDPELVQTLQDQRQAGKKLMLITNSEWPYTCFMMTFAFDRYLPEGSTWKDLFDMVIVSARKPAFFEEGAPIFKVINDQGLLEPCVQPPPDHRFYLGGNATHVEQFLGISGDRILYVGDHIFSDVNISKKLLRWRTALILWELEEEVLAMRQASPRRAKIEALMEVKKAFEGELSWTRLALQRLEHGGSPTHPEETKEALEKQLEKIRADWGKIDEKIIPLVVEESQNFNKIWGYLMWDGKDKSHLTHQVEKYADLYTSRVSNFLHYTPFCFFRAPRGSTPHDPVSTTIKSR